MKIYCLTSDPAFRCLCWDQESPETDRLEGEFVRQFRTGDAIDPWVPPPIRFMTEKEDRKTRDRGGKTCEISDSPFYSAATWFLSSRARAALHDALHGYGQFLPVPIGGQAEGLFVFNCTTVIDALDRDKSDVEFYPGGRPRSVRKFAVRWETIGDSPLFRLQWPQTFALYVPETTVKLVARKNLTGFLFSEL